MAYYNMSYKVCIRCMTYNQSAYITDALNGFAMQQTNFPFVAVIVDDASTDGEQEVIKSYIEKYFDHSEKTGYREWESEDAHWTFARHKINENCHFVTVFLKRNLYKDPEKKEGVIKDWMNANYIALCEGDDYWTDSLKLQKQIDFMERCHDCCMISHAAFFDVGGEQIKLGCQKEIECDLTTDEVIRNGGLYLATASLVFRKELLGDRPEWLKMADVGDYPLQILGTLRGTMHFFPEIMCVYRYQHPGSWTNKTLSVGMDVHHLKTEVSWLSMFDEETNFNYTDAVNSHLIGFYSALYRNKHIALNEYFKVFIKVSPRSYKRLFRDILIRSFYGLYRMYKK